MTFQSSLSYEESLSQQVSELSKSWSFLHNNNSRPSWAAISLSTLVQSSKSDFLLYDSDTDDEFQEWWKTISWVIKHLSDMKWKNIHFWYNVVQSSSVWLSYEQIVSVTTKESKMICMRCEQLLAHSTMMNAETSLMRRYLDCKACQSMKNLKNKDQSSLVSAFNKMISNHLISTSKLNLTLNSNTHLFEWFNKQF